MNKHIVLISGQQGSGKSTLANALGKEISKVRGWYSSQMIFAGTIYEMHNFCLGRLRDLGIDIPNKKDGKLLQFLGTNWGRETYGEDIWVDCVAAEMEKIEKMRNGVANTLTFIISDCRFENELFAFPEALRIRLLCPEEVRKTRAESWREDTKHPSEVGLDKVPLSAFDMCFNTSDPINSPEHMAILITAKLQNGTWMEKRLKYV
jgi:energy-coupling factor transporter ATP-binding protein EcfA2